MLEFAENCGIFPYVVESVRKTLFSSDAIGEVKPSTEGWTVERRDWVVPANQQIKRKLNPSSGWKYLQGSGIHRGHLVGGCLDVFDWARGTEIFPDNWQDAILFMETSEEALPPEFVARTLRVYAAMGILPKLSGILFARPGGEIPPDTFDEYDRAILQVVKEEQGLSDLPIISQMDFGHTGTMFVLPYGLQAELDMDQKHFSIVENAVVD
jgi:muramoyltetrapeptide carboxypeptidase LdcA involved in peptidoglycan recycling